MPYININEYDYTITGPKNLTNNNIVAIPINADDGPYDKWVTVYPYDSFVQMFGDNPDPYGQFGNSWEYAANLLLRGMPVCVRRIATFLDSEGNNTPEFLPSVSLSKTILKVLDVTGHSVTAGELTNTSMVVSDPNGESTLKASKAGPTIRNPYFVSKKCLNPQDEASKTNMDETPFTSEYDLQMTYTTVPQPESDTVQQTYFADLAIPGQRSTIWKRVRDHVNPHYKKLDDNDPSYLEVIQANPSGETGDFYVDNSTDAAIKYTTKGITNPYLLNNGVNYLYPDELSLVSINDSEENKVHYFAYVTYDANNNTYPSNTEGRVWVYNSDAETEVRNHYYIYNESFGTPFTNESQFPDATYELQGVTYNLIDGLSWLEYQPENGNLEVRVWSNNIWITAANISNYQKMIKIPFENTNEVCDTGIYQKTIYWELTNDENYFTNVGWENTDVVTGSDDKNYPHFILDGTQTAINLNEITLDTTANLTTTSIKPYVSFLNNQINRNITIGDDTGESRIVSGTYGFTNIGITPIKLYSFKLWQKDNAGKETLVYDMGLEKLVSNNSTINNDPLIQFIDKGGNYVSNLVPQYDEISNKWYLEIDPGMEVKYNKNISGAKLITTITAFDEIDVRYDLFKSANGKYELDFTSKEGYILDAIKWSIATQREETIDYDDIPVTDGNGSFNLFKVEYLYPGTNGNHLSVSLKTVVGQGVYFYVYRNNQFLERIELCALKQRDPQNSSRVVTLNIETQTDDIWRMILLKFGIMIINGLPQYTMGSQQSLYGNYVKIDLNNNITDFENLDYVTAILSEDGTKKYRLNGGKAPSNEDVMHEVPKCFYPLTDKYRYDVKFVTSGTYVDNFNDERLVETAMVNAVTSRKDCVAYLDAPYEITVDEIPFYFDTLSTSYAAAYDPWCYVALATGTTKWMPPSFVMLYTHAKSMQNGNKVYLPPAGVRRALVPEILQVNHELPSRYITDWQNNESVQFINPIIWINGFDYSIYGQKTLYNIVNQSDRYESALQDLNVRLVANDIKKLIFRTCIELTFELNNMHTWLEFKSKLEPTLSTMLGEGVLSDYEILMGSETMTKADLNSGHIVGTVRVSITRAATDWDINFEITPQTVTVFENDYNSQYTE